MTYVTKRCPYCNERLTFMEPKKISLGTPFRTCPRCGKTYIDKSYREIAVSGAPTIYRISPLWVIMFPFFLFGLIIILTSYTDDSFLPVCGLGLLLIIDVVLMIGDWKSYDEEKSFVALETLQSENRLSNPKYAAALKELGYRVPERYLSPVKDTDAAPRNTDDLEVPRPQERNATLPDNGSPEESENTVYYIETPDAMTVRVPEDKLEAWENADHDAPLTPEEEKFKEALLQSIYGSKAAENNVGSPVSDGPQRQNAPPPGNHSSEEGKDAAYCIEILDGMRPQISVDKLTAYKAADHGALHIPPDIYARAVRKKLDIDPYAPTYHKGARNPYTNTIITCEEDYIEYINEFVYDKLTTRKYKTEHNAPQVEPPTDNEEKILKMLSQLNNRLDQMDSRLSQMDSVQATKQNTSAPVRKTVSHTASRRSSADRVPIPFWRNTRILTRLALGLMALALPISIIYAYVTSPSAHISHPPAASIASSPLPTSSPLPEPLATPRSGRIYFENSDAGDRIAPLTIDASGCPQSAGFLIKLRFPLTKRTVLTFFVRGDTKVTIDVPLGRFELLYASGAEWYGKELLFGPETRYYLADELFDFYEEDGYVNGWTLTLDRQYNGNLDMDTIDAAEFDPT